MSEARKLDSALSHMLNEMLGRLKEAMGYVAKIIANEREIPQAQWASLLKKYDLEEIESSLEMYVDWIESYRNGSYNLIVLEDTLSGSKNYFLDKMKEVIELLKKYPLEGVDVNNLPTRKQYEQLLSGITAAISSQDRTDHEITNMSAWAVTVIEALRVQGERLKQRKKPDPLSARPEYMSSAEILRAARKEEKAAALAEEIKCYEQIAFHCDAYLKSSRTPADLQRLRDSLSSNTKATKIKAITELLSVINKEIRQKIKSAPVRPHPADAKAPRGDVQKDPSNKYKNAGGDVEEESGKAKQDKKKDSDRDKGFTPLLPKI